MALNLKRMVSTIFRYPQIYCSAGTTVGFSSFCFCQQVLYYTLPRRMNNTRNRAAEIVYADIRFK